MKIRSVVISMLVMISLIVMVICIGKISETKKTGFRIMKGTITIWEK